MHSFPLLNASISSDQKSILMNTIASLNHGHCSYSFSFFLILHPSEIEINLEIQSCTMIKKIKINQNTPYFILDQPPTWTWTTWTPCKTDEWNNYWASVRLQCTRLRVSALRSADGRPPVRKPRSWWFHRTAPFWTLSSSIWPDWLARWFGMRMPIWEVSVHVRVYF